MDLRSIYSSTFAVFRETRLAHFLLIHVARRNQALYSTLSIAVERLPEIALLWRLILNVWRLAKHSSLHSRKVSSFIDENMQKPRYDFRISKVMVVCINTCSSICDFQSYSKIDLSQTDFITKYIYSHLNGLSLTSNN